MPFIIDAHTHLVSPDRDRYPQDPTTYQVDHDGSAELLKSEMDAAAVDRAYTISPWIYRWDNSYVLDVLPENREWLAVGVLVNPYDPDGPATLERLVKERGASGVRIQGRICGNGPFTDEETTPLWKKAADLGLTIDVNATQEEYASLEPRLKQFPDTPILLDHCGFISAELSPDTPTVEPVIRLARYPNAYAKLSFLGLASNQAYPFTDGHRLVKELVDAFGPERCMFGTNFPTKQYNPKASYSQLVRLFTEEIDLTAEEREWILGKTAVNLWQWG